MTRKECFAVLGLNEGADLDEIKRAYRKLAFSLHPDLNPDVPDAAKRFQRVNEAYVLLSKSEPSAKTGPFRKAARPTSAEATARAREEAKKAYSKARQGQEYSYSSSQQAQQPQSFLTTKPKAFCKATFPKRRQYPPTRYNLFCWICFPSGKLLFSSELCFHYT